MNQLKVKQIVEAAITNQVVLEMVYQHTSDGETVEHRIAPFDIGTTNPAKKKQFEGTLFAYSYTHLDKEGKNSPRACSYKIANIVELIETDERFDPIVITDANKKATGYDYRDCDFLLLPKRDWYE